MMNIQVAISEWQTVVGPAQVIQSQVAQQIYGADTSGIQRRIAAAIQV